MGLNIALDELRATGWLSLDSAGCSFDSEGRAYPGVARVSREFAEAGYGLEIKHLAKFNCVQAEWRDAAGADIGHVVGQTPEEAAVYALAQLRRSDSRRSVTSSLAAV